MRERIKRSQQLFLHPVLLVVRHVNNFMLLFEVEDRRSSVYHRTVYVKEHHFANVMTVLEN